MNKIYPKSIDTHVHTTMVSKKGTDIIKILDDCFEQGMAAALDAGVTASHKAYEDRRAMADKYPNLFLAAGMHPSDSRNLTNKSYDIIKKQLTHPKNIALGEIGLDLFRDYGNIKEQKDLFITQIEIAQEMNLPVLIHNREADDHVYNIIAGMGFKNGGIMHCYSSDYEWAKKFIDLGFYLSFAGNVTYKKAENIQETAKKIPLDRLFTETDAPYLSPQKMRGKTNHPGYMAYTLDFIAELREISVEKIVEQIYDNFISLFGAVIK